MKRITSISWDKDNLRHLLEDHDRCTVRDVEDILLARCHPTRRFAAEAVERHGKTEVRRVYHGRTCRGRYLVIVAADELGASVRPITCWPLAGHHQERYVRWRDSQPR